MSTVRAVLRSPRDHERPIQYLGHDIQTVVTMADQWLDARGQSGDRFEVYQVEEHLVRTVSFTGAETKPAEEITLVTTARGALHHAFVAGSGLNCDKCGATEESHQAA